MDEKKEQRKTKIKKLIKIIGFIILGFTLIILLLGTCKKTKALEPIENYNIYTNLGQIEAIYEDNNINGLYHLEFMNERIYYYYNNRNYELTERYRHYSFVFDEDLLQYEISETLKIEINELQTGTIVIFGGLIDTQTETYQIDRITTITRYLDAITDTSYSNGYAIGINAELPEIWQQGYDKALEDMQEDYNKALDTLNTQYQNGLQSKDEEIARLEGIINSQNPQWGSFKSLLGLIVTYPIQLFKEGLNVELFGVNVGQFILGIGILIILMSILGFILGGRIGGKGKNE